MSDLGDWVQQVVSVITNDGRNLIGRLRGFDQCINVVLEECHERVYSANAPVQQVPLGLYVVRGDNITLVGKLEEDIDANLDLSTIRAEPLKPVVH